MALTNEDKQRLVDGLRIGGVIGGMQGIDRTILNPSGTFTKAGRELAEALHELEKAEAIVKAPGHILPIRTVPICGRRILLRFNGDEWVSGCWYKSPSEGLGFWFLDSPGVYGERRSHHLQPDAWAELPCEGVPS